MLESRRSSRSQLGNVIFKRTKTKNSQYTGHEVEVIDLANLGSDQGKRRSYVPVVDLQTNWHFSAVVAYMSLLVADDKRLIRVRSY